MSATPSSLSAAANERKARLAKLASLKRKQPGDDDAPEAGRTSLTPPANDIARLHLSGRNYDADTKGPKLGFEINPLDGLDRQTLEEQAAEAEAEAKRKAAEEEAAQKGIDLSNLQPKKPHADFKRELNKKLEVLNVRTDNAIARLVIERTQAKKAATETTDGAPSGADELGGREGAALVESMRLREKEDEEEDRREREEDVLQ